MWRYGVQGAMSTAMLPEPEWSARAEAWRRVGATDLLVDIGAASSALARVRANSELRDLWTSLTTQAPVGGDRLAISWPDSPRDFADPPHSCPQWHRTSSYPFIQLL